MKILIKISLALATIFLLNACSKVPVTGRRQFNLLPESQLMGMSFTQYQDVLAQSKILPENDDRVIMVKRVGDKIAQAAQKYLDSHNQSKRTKGFEWEFNVIEENMVNAWCMPGGKVAFYTGILPITQTEAGIAVVMGHEVAHAIARHGNERMSQQLAVQMGGIGLSKALEEKPDMVKNIFLSSYGLGSQLGSLKYSRSHESEGDMMGLVFMAMAGYNPEEAIDFWGRMSEAGGQQPPEFMSTHPSHETRINDLKEYLPEAMKYYNK
jgi:predicted Zn-dependent protease